MIRKYIQHTLIALLPAFGLITMQSCERINQIKEDGLQVAKDYGVLQSEFAAIIEVADELGSQTTGKGIPIRFLTEDYGKQAIINVIDSTYFDGDGIEFEINFGPTSLPLSENQRGYDGKYRAGKMRIKIRSHYIEKTSKLEIEIDKSEKFCVGSNPNKPRNIAMSCSMTRRDAQSHDLEIESLEFVGDNSLSLKGVAQLTKLTNTNPAIIGNRYQLTGKGDIEASNNDKFAWEIMQPLIKNVVPGCAGEFIKGILEIKDSSKSNTITIDYDPFENESCDRIIRVTLAGKSTDITLE